MILAVGFSYMAFMMLRYVPSIPAWYGFYQERMLYFVKCFFCIYWEDHVVLNLSFINVMYYIDWFAHGLKEQILGAPGWHSRLSVRLQPGHDLAVCELEPRVRLWADGSEPGACFRFCVSLSLCPSPVHALSLSVPKINKRWKKKLKKKLLKPSSK